jgi:hypothetical protein
MHSSEPIATFRLGRLKGRIQNPVARMKLEYRTQNTERRVRSKDDVIPSRANAMTRNPDLRVLQMKHWLIVLTVFLFACSTTGTKGPAGTTADRHVEGNKIFVGDELYAELIFIGKHNYADGQYKGVAIHYFEDDVYGWISPKKGWSLEKNGEIIENIEKLQLIWGQDPWYKYTVLKGKKRVSHETYFKVEWRWDVTISDDGQSVYYNEVGLFGKKRKTFKVN